MRSHDGQSLGCRVPDAGVSSRDNDNLPAHVGGRRVRASRRGSAHLDLPLPFACCHRMRNPQYPRCCVRARSSEGENPAPPLYYTHAQYAAIDLRPLENPGRRSGKFEESVGENGATPCVCELGLQRHGIPALLLRLLGLAGSDGGGDSLFKHLEGKIRSKTY